MGYVKGFKADPVVWEQIQIANSVHLKRFYCNVDLLCCLRYGSRANGVKNVRKLGLSAKEHSVKHFKDGLYTDSKLSNLQKWCLLFNVDLVTMLSRDLAADPLP